MCISDAPREMATESKLLKSLTVGASSPSPEFKAITAAAAISSSLICCSNSKFIIFVSFCAEAYFHCDFTTTIGGRSQRYRNSAVVTSESALSEVLGIPVLRSEFPVS